MESVFPKERGRRREVSEAQDGRAPVSSFGILRRDKTGGLDGLREHPELRIRLGLEIRGWRV